LESCGGEVKSLDRGVLELEGVDYRYPDGTAAIEGLNISIPAGRKVAFLGPNGAGKTTLFFIMNGSYRPQRGTLRFRGKTITYHRDDLKGLRQKVGLVFQDPNVQVFSMTVEQEISFGPKNLHLDDREVAARVEMAMELTGIGELRDRATHFLSFGEKKLVSLASILAMEPEVLIMDEPLSGLDPRQSRKIAGIMDWLSMTKTLILSTHNVDMAFSWADHVFIMKKGRLLAEGRTEEVFSDQRIMSEAQLEAPRIFQLYSRLVASRKINPSAVLPRTQDELLGLMRSPLVDYDQEPENINFCLNYL
jgi:cobalt/nickel transport system ATP-binding protein